MLISLQFETKLVLLTFFLLLENRRKDPLHKLKLGPVEFHDQHGNVEIKATETNQRSFSRLKKKFVPYRRAQHAPDLAPGSPEVEMNLQSPPSKLRIVSTYSNYSAAQEKIKELADIAKFDYEALEKENKQLKKMIASFAEEAEEMQKTLRKWTNAFKTFSSSNSKETIESSQYPEYRQIDSEEERQELLATFTERAKAAPLFRKLHPSTERMEPRNKVRLQENSHTGLIKKTAISSSTLRNLPPSSDSEDNNGTNIRLTLPFKTAKELLKFEKKLRRPRYFKLAANKLMRFGSEITSKDLKEASPAISFMTSKILCDDLLPIFSSDMTPKSEQLTSANFPEFIKLFTSSAIFFVDPSMCINVNHIKALALEILSSDRGKLKVDFSENDPKLKSLQQLQQLKATSKRNKQTPTANNVFIPERKDMDECFLDESEKDNSDNDSVIEDTNSVTIDLIYDDSE